MSKGLFKDYSIIIKGLFNERMIKGWLRIVKGSLKDYERIIKGSLKDDLKEY